MGWELGVPTHTGREPDARVQARLPKHLSPGCSGRAECHISPGYLRSAGPECVPRWLGAGCQRGQAAVTELHGQPVGMVGPDRDSLGIGSAWWRQPLRCCRSVCPMGSSSPHGPRPACLAGTFSRTSNLSGLSQCETCPAGLACPPGEWGGGKAASLPGVRSQLHAEVWRPGSTAHLSLGVRGQVGPQRLLQSPPATSAGGSGPLLTQMPLPVPSPATSLMLGLPEGLLRLRA